MSLFDKFQPIADIQADLQALGIMPFGAVTEKLLSSTEAIVNGHKVILAGTNNYLGLTFEPECLEAAKNAIDELGTGTTGSRMANGTFAGHVALEKELAEFFDRKRSIVFSTGYAATMGMGSTLAGPGDVIVLDADSHASIYDGVRLGGADVIRFRHNDPADLDKRLRRLGDRIDNTLIIVEGIYSMMGDQAPLAEIAEVKRKYGGLLLVDEAHSLGMLGDHGRGVAEAAGVEDDVDFVVGTFSKSLGSIGGYCVSNHDQLDAIRFAIRAYIFTASPSPSVIASTRAALRLMQERPYLRDQLWANAQHLYDGLKALGLQVSPEVSPVVAVTIKNRNQAIDWWNRLLQRGAYVNLVMPPASPTEDSLLRCSVSAAHSAEQIDRIIEAFANVQNTPVAN
ncbi:serine palmitoyltransferase [Thiogranum longum]|uniref:Serine palmitoyltransferase n=1 Tax=Thiogranum longum TaxID=1537524 RepID=A0A4R1HAV5_9GAMM|nr:pyridoxal phosphate-dependent aminotransferase family protein [Thiogranum longum]TCK19087.1 serine palmitoyltransferase [Thiogranum longum]